MLCEEGLNHDLSPAPDQWFAKMCIPALPPMPRNLSAESLSNELAASRKIVGSVRGNYLSIQIVVGHRALPSDAAFQLQSEVVSVATKQSFHLIDTEIAQQRGFACRLVASREPIGCLAWNDVGNPF